MKNEAALHHARQVSTALTAMASGHVARPVEADRFDWSSDVLDEIARGTSTLGDVVEAVTGDADDDITRLAADLATAIIRRRNELLRDGAPARRRAMVRG